MIPQFAESQSRIARSPAFTVGVRRGSWDKGRVRDALPKRKDVLVTRERHVFDRGGGTGFGRHYACGKNG